MDGIVIDDEIKITIQLDEGHTKNILAKLVERYMISYIRTYYREIANLIYPDSADDDAMVITRIEPIPSTRQRPFGYYTKGKSWKRIYGCCCSYN